jgi:type I restriction enzyme M protein
MLTSHLKQKIDALWNKFWAGGLANPLLAIDQINYLLFLKQLEDAADLRQARARAQGEKAEDIFAGAEDCRWSHWRNYAGEEMLAHVQNRVFPWLKERDARESALSPYMRDATFLIPKASLLVEAVRVIDDLEITDQNVDTQGDIFEYMLSKLNVAGQIGQFRTPRHVIRAITALANPQVGEQVLDPACGTGGFLIAAAQHIIARGTSADLISVDEQGTPQNLVGDRLGSEDWDWLRGKGLLGYDFDPSMARIAAMNLMLHGISRPNIHYADVLGPRFSHTPRAQVILANPPFSGSIDESDISEEFAVQTKKTELLFLQLFLDLLEDGGRAAVIVPEGVLMGSDAASKAARLRLLDDNTLNAVIALPHSTFKPYASVSTAILVFSRGGKTDRVWMYRVQADGFSQNAARTPMAENDLPDLVEQWGIRERDDYSPQAGRHGWVSRERIGERDEELAPRLHLQPEQIRHDFPTASLGEVCELQKGRIPATKVVPGPYPFLTTAEQPLTSERFDFEGEAICIPLVSSTGHGHASIKRLSYVSGRFAAATIVAVAQVKDDSIVLPRFLFFYLEAHKDDLLVSLMRGAANVSLSLTKLASVQVPVPTIEEQLAFIAELDSVAAQRTALAEEEARLVEEQATSLVRFKARFQG